MAEVSNKQITKVIVYYSDGSFEEIVKASVWPATPYPMPVQPYPYTASKCMVCGGSHANGMPCPSLNPMSMSIPCVGPGCEDPGAQ